MSNLREIPGTSGKYLAGDDGAIYSANFHRAVGRMVQMRQFPNRFGYLSVQLRLDGRGRSMLVHRLVAMAFIPNPDALPQVNHRDGSKTNNSATNLEWVSASQNIRHSIAIGIKPILRGEKHGMAVLTAQDVIAIRGTPVERKYGHATALARQYGVLPTHIRSILTRRTWKHVP